MFFVAGFLMFLTLFFTKDFFVSKLPFANKTTIGMVGAYDANNLPNNILLNVSKGLTSVDVNGNVSPALASSWSIDTNNKKYTFKLRKGIWFSDGTPFNSKSVNYNFSDAKIERPDDYTIVFTLKENYSPFLVTVSKPIFKKGFVGVGDYKINSIKFNGNFVESITLSSIKENYKSIKYEFYPTQASLKTAFVLGEVSEIRGITDIKFKNTTFDKFKGTSVQKGTDDTKLVALFYNTQDPVLSDNRLRKALTYAIPDNFSLGERNFSPFAKSSWVRSETAIADIRQDYNHSQLLMGESSASTSGKLVFEIKTLPQYEASANEISAAWKKLNIQSTVKVVDSIPPTFQIFLGDFNLTGDPDEYPLWHSGQPSNITKYRSLRIDKLLEDGRKEVSVDSRKQIYANFEKYILDDSPASFLFLPYSFDVTR